MDRRLPRNLSTDSEDKEGTDLKIDEKGRAEVGASCTNGSLTSRSTGHSIIDVGTLFHFGPLVARSRSMQSVLGTLNRLAPTELTITLIGETGTGKDVLAHAIHEHSSRREGQLVIFDCGAVASNLAESELFGHERGSFTGATSAHLGAFERANGGTLFLDEIGELPLELQPRLLRALENRGVRRVGGTQYRPVDLRILAATNRDLRACVGAGTFREDLFYRLTAAVVPIPPLRERLEDLELIVPNLLRDLGYPNHLVAPPTYNLLRTHQWPGNVRELKNVLSSAMAFVEGAVILPEHLRFLVQEPNALMESLPLAGRSLESLEIEAIRQALELHEGNKSRAARALGISASTLYEKLKRYGI